MNRQLKMVSDALFISRIKLIWVLFAPIVTTAFGSPIVHFDATSLELEDGAVVELWDGKTAKGDPV